ncbi:hypothetical protein [Kangiella aquimarina]|uniref:Uncharacterized protein n=1 Tax=Kangiella aquimarina TaxID=261965 RepID=A0ABZ0X682_9GAMM|nr:hypothetical protein [Kangiella aquimarina]WQG85901.1 hypothetical protein SR900_03215 [Kangiella aquimarina]
MQHKLFLEIINRDDPKLRLAYNQTDNCWGWYGYDGMGRYAFLEIRNKEVLSSVKHYFKHKLIRPTEDIYVVEAGCECTIYELVGDSD